MRQISTLIVFLLAIAYCYGQQPVNVPKKDESSVYRSEKVKAFEAQFFCCPQCDFISKVKGACPYHQLTLIKAGTYYCSSNYQYTSTKAGSCPEHKTPLKEMVPTYKQPDSSSTGNK
jgi:hypothetical protein